MEIFPVDPASDTPPFEQLRQQIARRCAAGELTAGERLPTVRGLAGALGLATNTVARAYKELEADGVVVTQGRKGTFIKSAAHDSAHLRDLASDLAAEARRAGLTRHEAARLLDDAWDHSART